MQREDRCNFTGRLCVRQECVCAKSLVYPRHLLIGQLVLRQQLWRGRSHLQNGNCENVMFDAAVVIGGAPAHPPATVL